MTTQSNLLSVLLSSSKESGREGEITCAPALPGYSSWGWKEQEQFPRRGTDSAPKETFLNCLACFPSSIINPLYLPIVAISTVSHTSNVNTNTGKQQVCRREAQGSGALPALTMLMEAGPRGSWGWNQGKPVIPTQVVAASAAPRPTPGAESEPAALADRQAARMGLTCQKKRAAQSLMSGRSLRNNTRRSTSN